MSDSTNTVLQRAYELIEIDELEQAQELLAPLLETDDKNPALWWVYSHALRDQSIGQLALDRVLELDPSYPGANELKEDVLEIQSRDPDFLQVDVDESASAQEVVDAIDDWDDLRPGLEDGGEDSSGRLGAVALALILFVVAAGIALVASGSIDVSEILSGILPSPEAAVIVVEAPIAGPATSESEPDESAPDATAQATDMDSAAATAELTQTTTVAQATEAARMDSTAATTAEDDLSPTLDGASELVSAFVRNVADSISDFEIDPLASSVRDTLLGRTIVIHVCAVPGSEFSTRLNRVIDVAVELADAIPEGAGAVAAGLLNCDDEDAALRIIGVAVETIRQYLDEDIDSREFQRAIQLLS